MTEPAFSTNVRAARLRAAISQAELATRAGVSRQTVNRIEGGRWLPGTDVALRLASALNCRVEDLFTLHNANEEVVVGGRDALVPGDRVVLSQIDGRLVAHPLRGPNVMEESFVAADGHVSEDGRVQVVSGRPGETAIIAGCDPSLSILVALTNRANRRGRLTWLHAASEEALDELASRRAHVGGTHLPGPADEANTIAARRALAGQGGLLVSYATWEQGLVVAPGNPRGIRSVAELAQPGVRVINREPASGSRRLLDAELAHLSVSATALKGYENEARTHMAVARAVAAGAADAGIALRAVSHALGLDFVPLAIVRFDLAIPTPRIDHPAVAAMLDVLHSSAFRTELAALPGYDVSHTGSTLLSLPAAA